MHLVLNLSQSFIVNRFGKLTFFPFKVTLPPFQSISIMSQIKFHFNFTFSGTNVPVIMNRFMLPAILHNFIST